MDCHFVTLSYCQVALLRLSWYGINYKPYLLTPPPNYYVPPSSTLLLIGFWVGWVGTLWWVIKHVHDTLMLHPPHTIIDLVGLVYRVVVGQNETTIKLMTHNHYPFVLGEFFLRFNTCVEYLEMNNVWQSSFLVHL
jgi:hypothetical protein